MVEFGKPLGFQEWDIPTPRPGQIPVKTEACGVCHTDVHAWHGDWPVKPVPPFIPGHEGVGPVVAVGPSVAIVKVGGKLAHAKQLGADLVVNAKVGNPIAAVKDGTCGGAHGVLITAPSLGAFKQGVGMTPKRGTCVLNGLPPGEFPTPLFDVVANCITLRGSFVGTRQDMAEALAFAAEGKVKADCELQPLSAINQVLDRLEHGQVASRVVLDFVAC